MNGKRRGLEQVRLTNVAGQRSLADKRLPMFEQDFSHLVNDVRVGVLVSQQESIDGGGRWLQNAVVQLGYNGSGQGIIFVAEQRESVDDNVLFFSDKGMNVADDLLDRLTWAPILPVSGDQK